MITVVDYGVGNIGALLNMFDYLGIDAETCDDATRLAHARTLVLPGVGSFDKAMRTLRERGFIGPLREAVFGRGASVLGVCLGMQLLARRSEEGDEAGLGWIDADVRRIVVPLDSRLKVPHIGWMDVRPARGSLLFDPARATERFYFDHSYHVVCDRDTDVAACIDYGSTLCCAVQAGRIGGVQFHPEKSHRFGMRLLGDFARSSAAHRAAA